MSAFAGMYKILSLLDRVCVMNKQKQLKVFDLALAREQLGWQEDIVRNVIAIFKASLEEETDRLHVAYAQQDWSEIKAVCHKLRGGARYCAALRLQQACKELEEAIIEEKDNQWDALYQEVLDEIALVKKEIQQIC